MNTDRLTDDTARGMDMIMGTVAGNPMSAPVISEAVYKAAEEIRISCQWVDITQRRIPNVAEITPHLMGLQSTISTLKVECADLKFQRDALLEMTWLDLPSEPVESTHKWKELFAAGWERRDATTVGTDERIAKLTTERDKLSEIRAKFVMDHLERICGECGHDKDDEGQCANCIIKATSEEMGELRKSFDAATAARDARIAELQHDLEVMHGALILACQQRAQGESQLAAALTENQRLTEQLAEAHAMLKKCEAGLRL